MFSPSNLYHLLIIKLVSQKQGYFDECNNLESEVVDNGLNLTLASWFHVLFWRLNFEKNPNYTE